MTEEQKPTPGPWGLESSDHTTTTYIVADGKRIGAAMTYADARLMQAAPDTLQKLVYAHELIDWPTPHEPGVNPTRCTVCEAIAQARGEL